MPSFTWNLKRISLRAFLAGVTIIGAVLGMHLRGAQRQRTEAAKILQSGGTASYGQPRLQKVTGTGVGISLRKLMQTNSTSWVPDWLRNRLGVDFFESVTGVIVGFNNNYPKSSIDFSAFPKLRNVSLAGDSANDQALQSLSKCKYLNSIYAQPNFKNGNYDKGMETRPEFTAEGAKHLQRLKRLTRFTLENGRCNQGFLDALAGVRSLELISLRGLNNSGEGLKSLSKCSKLRSLQISDIENTVQPAEVAALQPLKNLNHLSLFGNIPEATIGTATDLRKKRHFKKFNVEARLVGRNLRTEQILFWLSQYDSRTHDAGFTLVTAFEKQWERDEAMDDLHRHFKHFLTTSEINALIDYIRAHEAQITVGDAVDKIGELRWNGPNLSPDG